MGYAEPFQDELQPFYQLTEVCKKFDSICKHHPSFGSCLYLRESLDADALPGMFQWIQHHASSVQTIIASPGSPYIEAALAALQSHQHTAGVTAIHLGKTEMFQKMPDTVLLLVVQFTSLVTCTLDMSTMSFAPHLPEFDLYALKELPHLSMLTLANGHFTSVDSALHLTQLYIRWSQAMCSNDCACVTSLVELHLIQAGLGCFHTLGVCACPALRVLKCVKGLHSSQ